MNEFKFSCPHCHQNIQATPEYSGMQINCPTCLTPIVVPQSPSAAPVAAPSAPVSPVVTSLGAGIAPPPRAGKLSMAASTVVKDHTSPVMAAAAVRKNKKQPVGLYIGLGVGVVAVVLGIIFVPKAIDKYQEHKATVAAAEEAKKAPPPPPPDLQLNEILSKVDETYKGLTSYSVQGTSTATMDMSQLNPMMKDPQTIPGKISVLVAKPNLYRVEWERQMGPATMKGAVWSAGKGDYVLTGPSPKKVKDREAALATAGAMSSSLCAGLVEYVLDGANKLTTELKNPAKENNETIGSHKCYVISGDVQSQKMRIWIHKDDFLVAQAEFTLGGKVPDAAFKLMNAQQKQQAKMMEKIKGNIVDMYDQIETNKALTADVFQVANTPTATPHPRSAAPGENKRPGRIPKDKRG